MSEPTEREARIRELAAGLNPQAFAQRIADWTRGGLPSSSIPEGSRSADHPHPQVDKHDMSFNRDLADYGKALMEFNAAYQAGELGAALKALTAAAKIEATVLVEEHMTEERSEEVRASVDKKKSPRGIVCGNPSCTHRVMGGPKDPLLHGRCRKCGRYMDKHDGAERPEWLCRRDLDREIEARNLQIASSA